MKDVGKINQYGIADNSGITVLSVPNKEQTAFSSKSRGSFGAIYGFKKW